MCRCIAADILQLEPHRMKYQPPGPKAKCTSDSGSFGGETSEVSSEGGVGRLYSELGDDWPSSEFRSGLFSSVDRVWALSSSLAIVDLGQEWKPQSQHRIVWRGPALVYNCLQYSDKIAAHVIFRARLAWGPNDFLQCQLHKALFLTISFALTHTHIAGLFWLHRRR
jgi:hypothetical protein